MFSKQTIILGIFGISELFEQEHYGEYFIFLSNILFSAILEKAQFETTKLASVLNADIPLYRLIRVT